MNAPAPIRPLLDRERTYQAYRERLAAQVRRREVPSSRVTLVVSFGDPVRVLRPRPGRAAAVCSSMVIGLHDGAAETGLDGLQHGVQVRIDPLVAYSFFAMPMHLLGNEFVDLGALLGRDGDRLAERLHEADGASRRREVFDAVLARRAAAGPRPDPAVEWAWRRMRATAGGVRISALAERLGWSRRHLTRRFREQIGPAPKTVARVFRFEYACALLADRSRPRADIAIAAGYADQAHFNREMRAFAECTPVEFAATRRSCPAGDFVLPRVPHGPA